MKKQHLILTFLLIFQALFTFGQSPLSAGEHYADINEVKIHYFVRGKGPVCLVPTPGWGPSMNYLKNSMGPLENKFTMVYYDTRLSGKSTGPADTTKYSSNDFMNDMDGLRVHLKQDKVWIMGHSMGGFQVLYYGIHKQENLNGIIALHPMAGQDSLYYAEFSKMVMKRKGQPYFEKGADIFSGKDTTKYGTNEMMGYIFPFYFHNVQKIKDFEKLGNPEINDKVYEYITNAKFGTDYLFLELNKIKIPTLVVAGDDDFICDKVSQADRIIKEIPNASLIVLKDAGHFGWVEQPEQFFAQTKKWLKKQKIK